VHFSLAVPPARLEQSDDPVVAAWRVVHGSAAEGNFGSAQAFGGLLPDGVLTDLDGLIGVEGAARFIPAVLDWKPIWTAGRRTHTATPGKVELIPFGPAIGILNANDGIPAITGVANQFLPASTVNPGEAKVYRGRWQNTIAFEPPPLGRLPGQCSYYPQVSPDLNVGRRVNLDFDGALSLVAIAAAPNRSSTFGGLSAQGYGD
jgi:hypothetical protein